LSGSEPGGNARKNPRFSIIITFHNQRGFVTDAMNSALAQKDTDYEVIVVDDASSDGTSEGLKNYANAISLVCLDVNVGACGARNRGAAVARGDYLVFLDGDDAFVPWALTVYDRIVDATNPKLILASMKWFEEKLPDREALERPHEIAIVDYADYLRRDRGFGHSASAMVVARRAFEEVGGWQVGFFPLEDVEFALRLGTVGRTIQILQPATIWHRAHPGNSVNNVLSFMPRMEELLQRERDGAYPGGAARGFERRALLGGIAAHWVKRAAKSGLRGKALGLASRGSGVLFAGLMRRLGVRGGGRAAVEKIKI